MKIKRIIYIVYYFKKLNWSLFDKFIEYATITAKESKTKTWFKVILNAYKYNISLLEYFQFKFYQKTHVEKLKWAGTGFMYEYQLKMNPPEARNILDDKWLFYQSYKKYFTHKIYSLEEIKADDSIIEYLLSGSHEKLVFKGSHGKCGSEVKVVNVSQLNHKTFIDFMKNNNFDIIEEYIYQHDKLNELSPSAVNTVRVFTQLDNKGLPHLLGCRLRISVNSPIDNLAAGNLAAPIDDITGIITGPAIYSDITKDVEYFHPITKVEILGFKVPFWSETISMVKSAAIQHPQNKSIGWDVAITKNGPSLIEGNHDWCKLLWQLPVQKGLKHVLESYL